MTLDVTEVPGPDLALLPNVMYSLWLNRGNYEHTFLLLQSINIILVPNINCHKVTGSRIFVNAIDYNR